MTVQVNVPNVPKRIAKALQRDAKKLDMSVNDVAVTIIASQLGYQNGKLSRPYAEVNAEWLPLRMDEDLRRKLRIQAAGEDVTIRQAVINMLASHYELPA